MKTVTDLVDAANAFLAASHSGLVSKSGAFQKAYCALLTAVDAATGESAWANREERLRAVAEYGSDDCEIDDKAMVSRADDGLWVAAWVWLYAPEEKSEATTVATNYDFEHIVNDIEQTVINDGDGSQCGYTYQDRCGAAQFPGSPNQFVFLNAARNYDHCRVRAGAPAASEEMIQEAAKRLQAYYVEHVAEEGVK